MSLTYLRLSVCAALLLAACPPDGSMTTAGPDTTTGDTSTSGSPTSDPTSTTQSTDPTTSGSTTTTEGSSGTTTEGSSTGGQPGECSQLMDQNTCNLAPNCKWASVVSYTHGTQGCQGSIKDFCVPKDSDPAITSYWKDNNGDIEVLQFGFNPNDLGPDWKPCDCDGPLACLCTGAMLDCPDRLDDFCGAITGENGCTNAAAAGDLVCSWFRVRPTGPADVNCGDKAQFYTCLNATNVGSDTCENVKLPYPDLCTLPEPPVFWHDVDGEIEITKSCGPVPVGWTQCLADDPNQPEDCKCLCV
jgi:hypothetical protein